MLAGMATSEWKKERTLHHPKKKVMVVILQKQLEMQRLQSIPRTVLGKRMTITPTFCMNVTDLTGACLPHIWHLVPAMGRGPGAA